MFIIIISYLLGSIPSGLIISKKFYKIDVRGSGSGNIGATNMMRVLGKKPAILTFIFDVLKGILAVLIAKIYSDSENIQLFAAIFVVFGHVNSIWLKFKGGKGIETILGAFIILSPLTALFAAAVWIAAFYRTKISSFAGISAIICTPIASIFINKFLITLTISAISLYLLYKHRENIKRLINKDEQK